MAKNLWFGFWKASPRYITTDLIAKPSWYQVNHRNNCTKGFRTRGTVSLNIEVKELIRWHAVWGSHMLSKKIERLYAIHLPGFFSDLGWPIEPFFGRWCFKVSMKERVCSSQGNRWIFKQTITSLFICLADWWVPGRTYFSPDWRYLASREVGVNPRMALSVYEFENLISWACTDNTNTAQSYHGENGTEIQWMRLSLESSFLGSQWDLSSPSTSDGKLVKTFLSLHRALLWPKERVQMNMTGVCPSSKSPGRWFFWSLSCWRKDSLSQNVNCFLWTINLWLNTKIIRIALLPRVAVGIKYRCDESVIDIYAFIHFHMVCFEVFRCGLKTAECYIKWQLGLFFSPKPSRIFPLGIHHLY